MADESLTPSIGEPSTEEARRLCDLGNQHLTSEDFPRAVRAYRQALEVEPQYARAHHNLGVAYYKMGLFAQAADEVRRAIELRPELADFHFTLGLIHKDGRAYGEAIAAFGRALELDPDLVVALRYRGATYYEQGNNQSAIADFERALDRDPEQSDVAYDLAVANADAQNWAEAEKWFERAAELEPTNADIYFNLGLAHARDVNTPDSEAEAAFRRALWLDPHHVQARFRLGVLYAKAKYRYPAARGRAIEALRPLAEDPSLPELFPDAHLVQFALGTLYDDSPETSDQALECYERCLELAPSFAPALNNRGILLQRAKQTEEAAASFCEAILADPHYESAYHNLCELLYDEPDVMLTSQLRELVTRGHEDSPRVLTRLLLEMVDTAKADAYEESYQAVHKLKNLIALLGARMRGLWEELAARYPDHQRVEVELEHLSSLHASVFEGVTSYLDALQRREIRWEIIKLPQVLERVLGETREQRPEGVEVKMEADPRLPEVRGDASRLAEALANIVRNAYEAMSEGGELRLTAEPLPDTSSPSPSSFRGVRLRIADTGPGIPDEQRPRVLHPGYTTKPGGSGYGLPIAARILREHNGSMSIETSPDHGTTVTIDLPLNIELEKQHDRMRLRPIIFEDSRRLIQTELEEF
ncbi:MAG: tetratricopeptide repeat protein [Armatimonadota bacterium]